ncbi:MAG: hypothetical protein QOH90_703 [Actinomycetota bacterium]|jgi:hypothetical protein|nr:hypothetical protein [Actinomycetota bacterium]
MQTKTRLRMIVPVAVMVLVMGACSGGSDSNATSAGSGGDVEAPASQPRGNAVRVGDASFGSFDSDGLNDDVPVVEPDSGATEPEVSAAAALPQVEDHIIKTATLKIEVEKDSFREAVQQGIGIAEAHGGFVFSSSVDDKNAKRGSIVIRVPASTFESALKDAEGLGDVTGQTVTGEDVSQEFVDLKSRLLNSEAQEGVLLRLYDKATSVADTIRIQREVAGVQAEIEQLRGRIRFLEDKTSMSTITLNIAEAGALAAEDVKPQSTIGRAWERAVGAALAVVSATIVIAGAAFPLLILLVVLLAALRILRPKLSPDA